MDWSDQTMPHWITVQMLQPQMLDSVIGELEGIDLSNSSVSANYSTDTRTSAKLRVVNGNWVRGSWLRIIAHYPDYERELGTYVVSGEPFQLSGSVYDLELQSLLWAYAQDECPWPLTVSSGANVVNCAKNECGSFKTNFPQSSAKTTESITYDAGTNRLKRHFDLLAIANLRADVDGHGVFTAEEADLIKAPSFTVSLEDPKGIAHGDITRESDFLTMPNRAGVSYKWTVDGNDKAVYAHSDTKGNASPVVRGYAVTELKVLEDLNPPTQAHAQEEADKLRDSFTESVEWRLNCRYFPVWEGDAIIFDVSDRDPEYSGARTCRVESLELELEHMDMSLVLKEI